GANSVDFANTVATINDLTGGLLTQGEEFVLFQGNGSTDFTHGLTLIPTGTTGVEEIIGGLTSEFNVSGPLYSGQLFLDNNNNDIFVEVVPEPSTWAMMIGGAALLFFWQRRRSKLS